MKYLLLLLTIISLNSYSQDDGGCYTNRDELLKKIVISKVNMANFQKAVKETPWLLNKEEIKFSFDVDTNINYQRFSNLDVNEFNKNCTIIETTANTISIVNDAISEQPLVLSIIGSRYRKCLSDDECSGIITITYQESIPFVFKNLNGIRPHYSIDEQIKFIDDKLKFPGV